MFSGSLSVISAVFRSFPCAKQGHMVHSQQSTHQLRGCRLQQPIWGQTLGISHVTRIGWDPGTCVGQSLRISNRFLLRPDVEGAKLRPQGFGGEFRGENCWTKNDAFLQSVPNPAVFGNYLPGVMMPFPMPFLSRQSGSVKAWVPFMGIAPFNGNCIGVLDWQHYDISMMKTFRSLVMSPPRSRLEARGHLCCSNPMQVYSSHQHVWKGMS